MVDDNIALEGSQSFTIVVGSSTAMVNIIDDDCKFKPAIPLQPFSIQCCVYVISPPLVPEPMFETGVYSVPENGLTVPLCVDVGVIVAQPVTYTITTQQKNPPQAEGKA